MIQAFYLVNGLLSLYMAMVVYRSREKKLRWMMGGFLAISWYQLFWYVFFAFFTPAQAGEMWMWPWIISQGPLAFVLIHISRKFM